MKMNWGIEVLAAYTCLFAIVIFIGWVGVALAMGMWLVGFLTTRI